MDCAVLWPSLIVLWPSLIVLSCDWHGAVAKMMLLCRSGVESDTMQGQISRFGVALDV